MLLIMTFPSGSESSQDSCTVIVALLASVPRDILPAGYIGPYPETEVSDFTDIWLSAFEILKVCWDLGGALGWIETDAGLPLPRSSPLVQHQFPEGVKGLT